MAQVQYWEISNGPSGTPVGIYGRIANFNYFVETDVEDERGKACAGVSKQSQKIKAHSRRRCPGDPSPINVSEQPEGRQYLYKANKTSGSALPGRTFVLSDVAGTENPEKRSFQYTGPWKELVKYLESDAAKDFVMHNYNGSKILICKAEEAQG